MTLLKIIGLTASCVALPPSVMLTKLSGSRILFNYGEQTQISFPKELMLFFTWKGPVVHGDEQMNMDLK